MLMFKVERIDFNYETTCIKTYLKIQICLIKTLEIYLTIQIRLIKHFEITHFISLFREHIFYLKKMERLLRMGGGMQGFGQVSLLTSRYNSELYLQYLQLIE
jgi:hypothetical protein